MCDARRPNPNPKTLSPMLSRTTFAPRLNYLFPPNAFVSPSYAAVVKNPADSPSFPAKGEGKEKVKAPGAGAGAGVAAGAITGTTDDGGPPHVPSFRGRSAEGEKTQVRVRMMPAVRGL